MAATNTGRLSLLLSIFLAFGLFAFIVNFLVGCQGELTGPWTLEAMRSLKGLEHRIYWSFVLFVPLLSLGIYFLIAKIFKKTSSLNAPQVKKTNKKTDLLFLILLPLAVFVFTPRVFVEGNVDKMVEGHILEATVKADRGEGFYDEIFFIYGPGLEVYQTKLAFALFEESLYGLRKLQWFVEPLGAVMATIILVFLLRNKWLSLLILLPLLGGGAQIHPRMIFPLSVFMLVFLGLRSKQQKKQKVFYSLAGVLSVLAFFYSMENGPLIALSLFVPMGLIFLKDRSHATFFKWFSLGVLILGGPFFLWGLVTGRLFFLVDNFFMMKEIMLSYQGKPTPLICEPLMLFLSNPLSIFMSEGLWIRWWLPPLIFIGVITFGLVRIAKKNLDKSGIEFFILSASGIIFFFIVLGRTDMEHWLKGTAVYWPVLILVLERAVLELKDFWKSHKKKWVPILPSAMFLSLFIGLILNHARVSVAYSNLMTPTFLPKEKPQPIHPHLERLGPLHISPTDESLMAGIVERIKKYAEPKEPVFIFSREPIYYFLADVKNPTRYPHSILMVTPEGIDEVIKTLAKNPPRLVVAHEQAGKIDSQYFQEPIVDFIEENYKQVDRFGGYLFYLK